MKRTATAAKPVSQAIGATTLPEGKPMRVLIVDDHPIVISGCRALLAGDPDIVITTAADAESGEASFVAEPPDICVLDINLPSVSGFELARRILRARCDRAHHHVQHERRSGVRRTGDRSRRQGLCLEIRVTPTTSIDAIREVGKGDVFLPPAIAQSIAFAGPSFASSRLARLTSREIEILRLLSDRQESFGDRLAGQCVVQDDCQHLLHHAPEARRAHFGLRTGALAIEAKLA